MNRKQWTIAIALITSSGAAISANPTEAVPKAITEKLAAARERQLAADAEVDALEAEMADIVAKEDGANAQHELTDAIKALAKAMEAQKVTAEAPKAVDMTEPASMRDTAECKAVAVSEPNSLSGYKFAISQLLAQAKAAEPYEAWVAKSAVPSEAIKANGDTFSLDTFKTAIQCAKRLYAEARIEAAKLPQSSTTIAQAADKVSATEINETYAEIAHLDVYSKPQATLLIGPSFVLRGDGQTRGGVETTLLFDGGPKSFLGLGRTFTDVSFQSKGMTGTQPIPEMDPTVNGVLDQQFSSDKGYFRFNTGISTQINPRMSFALSGGLNAIPREGQEFLESLRERYTATLVTRTFLSQGIYTRFSAGAAYDKSWRYFNEIPTTTPPTTVTQADQRESYGRAIVNMELFLPQAGGLPGGISAAARLSLDTPINGNGPSEVRLSILAYFDFVDFFSALNPLYKAPG